MSFQGRPASNRDTHPVTPPAGHPRCQDRPVHPDWAALVGRVQATLIGAGRLAVAFAGDPQSALLATIGARALGTDRVTLLIDPTRRVVAPQADELAHAMATDLGLPVVHAPAGNPGRLPHEVPVDTIAYCDIPDGASTGSVPVRAVGDRRLLYPFALAGLTRADIDACADALGLSVADATSTPHATGLRVSGTGT